MVDRRRFSRNRPPVGESNVAGASFGRFADVTLQAGWGEDAMQAGAWRGWWPNPGKIDVRVEWDETFDTYVAKFLAEGDEWDQLHDVAVEWVSELRSQISTPWSLGGVKSAMLFEEDEDDGRRQLHVAGPSLGDAPAPELHRAAFDTMRFVADQVRLGVRP